MILQINDRKLINDVNCKGGKTDDDDDDDDDDEDDDDGDLKSVSKVAW